MQPADPDAFADEQIAQHAAAGKRISQMQLVNPPHDHEIGSRGRPCAVIDAAAADAEEPGLRGHRQGVCPIDHRFALDNSPALPSAEDKKSFSSVSSPILACSVLTSIAGVVSCAFSAPNWTCFGKVESTLMTQEDLHAPIAQTLYAGISG